MSSCPVSHSEYEEMSNKLNETEVILSKWYRREKFNLIRELRVSFHAKVCKGKYSYKFSDGLQMTMNNSEMSQKKTRRLIVVKLC